MCRRFRILCGQSKSGDPVILLLPKLERKSYIEEKTSAALINEILKTMFYLNKGNIDVIRILNRCITDVCIPNSKTVYHFQYTSMNFVVHSQILVTGRLKTPVDVFTSTTLTTLSFPGNTAVILPSGQVFLGSCPSATTTISPTATPLPSVIHFARLDKVVGNQYDVSPPKESLSSKALKLLYKRLYILQWLPKYTKGDILADFISGLTVGLTMMPQSIAYAGLAGIAPQYGLYAAFIGSFTYVFFGSVKEVSIGPTSLMSILTFSYTLGRPIECVILLTFIAGVVELLIGILDFGFMVDLISPCLTSGFTSATTVIIAMAQLKYLFGLKIKSHDCIGIITEFFQKINEVKWPDTIVAFSCFVFLIAFKQLPKLKVKDPSVKKLLWFLAISKNALIVLFTSLVAVYYHNNGGVPFLITGDVPKGLPDFGFPSLFAKFGNETVGYKEMITSLGSGVIVVPVVAVLANVAIAKAYSGEVIVDASQEMISLGLCNILGSFVKSMPSCGAFTRSAVASSSDVRTPLQGVYSGSVIILALSFLAPYFYFIPKATLAAVLITAASSLLDYEIFPILWRVNKLDFILTLMTFILGSLFGVEMALIIGCLCNLVALLKIWFRPRILVETRITAVNGKGQQYLYIKPELGLFYPSTDYVSEYIKKMSMQHPSLPIIIDCSNIIRVDYAAAKTLEILLKTYNDNNRKLAMINFSSEILETMRKVTDTEYLELCHSTDSIPEMIMEEGERETLLNGIKIDSRKSSLAERRKSSVRSESSRKTSTRQNEERKLSLYEFE